MLQYIVRRILLTIPTLFVISVVAFMVISLPPGDFVTSYVANLASQGEGVQAAVIEQMRVRYGLDQPVYIQYLKWMRNILFEGDFGRSFVFRRPVTGLIWQRLTLTLVLAFCTLVLTYSVALPVGVYSAAKQYSVGDYVATFLGFIGVAIPQFLLALVLMYVAFKYFDQSVIGLFSPEYREAAWNWGKVVDLLKHLWIPVIILGIAGTAMLIRIMRANLLDELHKPYVLTARAKGLSEGKLLFKYPVRVALNAYVSTAQYRVPEMINASTVISVVLNLPTTGPLLLEALRQQDMYLAGAFILLLSTLTIVGTLVSDIALAWVDPRIRYREV